MSDDFDDLGYHRDHVALLIWSGFFNESDLETYLADLTFDPDAAPYAQAVREHAQATFAAKRKAEADWPAVTDWDRLARAFNALEAGGILALHNAGVTTSDAHGDAWDIINRAAPSTWRGFAFYHAQDIERAMNGGALFIGFDAVAQGAEAKTGIGREIVATLGAHGFAPQWDGDPETRLHVPEIVWQKRTEWARAPRPVAAADKAGLWQRLFSR